MLVLNKVSADATVESVRNETEPGSLLAAAGDAIQQVYCTGNRTGLTNTHFSQTFEGVDLSQQAVQHFVCKSGRAHYPMAGISGRGA